MQDTKPLIEQTHSSEKVYSGALLHVYKDTAVLPDGSLSPREWIKHPGACAVVPVFENGDIMLLRQYRYASQQVFFEVPAGKIDPDEDPDTTALRELEEETGIRCKGLAYIGHFYPCIGYSDEVIHVYTAWDLDYNRVNADDDEFLEPFRLPFNEALRWVHDGTINDAKTIVCILRAARFWNVNQSPDR